MAKICKECGWLIKDESTGVCGHCQAPIPAEPEPDPSAKDKTSDVRRVTPLLASYDPTVIEKFAKNLYLWARLIEVFYAIIAALVVGIPLLLVGGTVGEDAGAFAAIGASVGAVLGYLVGGLRARELRLEAQVALCQAAIELNTRPLREDI